MYVFLNIYIFLDVQKDFDDDEEEDVATLVGLYSLYEQIYTDMYIHTYVNTCIIYI
jgi:hypothetical protein